jgi:tetratricopeptide (TPR) repeat protein
VQAGAVHGNVNINVAPPQQTVAPAQLPPCTPHFTDRDHELTLLTDLTHRVFDQGTPGLVVLSGAGGVGKTSLGLCWLHRIRDNFHDGQLFVDLLGLSGDPPMPPSEPLERFLRALGVAPERIPAAAEEQAAMYRSVTAGRRLLIMLDNAASAAQVRPLLPGHGPSVVLVTTRWRLSGLAVDGASFVSVGPLDEGGSIRLLDRMLGRHRIAAEPEAARSLADLCGRLPIALCTSAARLAVRDHWTIARVVAELSDERRRLAALSTEDDFSVRAVFDLSYQGLPADAARLYRLLGVHPGTDFDIAAAAAVGDFPGDDAARILDILVGANLLAEYQGDRYRLHDLIRLHAQTMVGRDESAESRRAAFNRLLDFYLATAAAADRSLIPGRPRLGGYFAKDPQTSFPNSTTAIEWLESELANLLAILRAAHERELHELSWQICEALWGVFVFRKHYRLWIDSHEIGLASARACADLRAQALMLESLSSAYLNLRDFPAAERSGSEALHIERAAGHLFGEGKALECIGVARLGLRDAAGAVDAFDRAMAIHERLGRPRGIAMMNRRLGQAFGLAGRYAEAIEHLARAYDVFVDLRERYNEARTLSTMAEMYLESGQAAAEKEALTKALAITTEIGAVHEQANIHVALARSARRRGELTLERDHMEKALVLYSDLGAPEADDVGTYLARRVSHRGPDDRDPP